MESPAVDLDSLLDSVGDGDVDGEVSTSPNSHHRTVDEILLSHSSSSPSPPSSPTAFYSALSGGDSTTAAGSSGNPSAIESDKFHSAAGPVAHVNRTKSTSRVLQQLFGSGAIRSNSKPGAALAAAAAASRSIPTPHATAIKLRRATIGSIYRSVSEATEKGVSCDDSSLSPSDGTFRVSESGSAVGTQSEGFGNSLVNDSRYQEGEEITLEQFHSGSVKLDSTKANTWGEFPVDDSNFADVASSFNTLTEVVVSDQVRNVGVDEECTISNSESQKESSTENEENLNQPLSCLLDEKNDEDPEIWGGFQSSNYSMEGAEVNDFGAKVAEPENVGDTGLQDIVTDTHDDSGSLLSNGRDSPLNRLSSPRPFDLAEETEKKQAFTGLHYEEGVAAQPMRLEGVHKSSTVLGYVDVNHNNAITRTVSSQAFRRDHGIPQVVAVHYNYIAVGMSRGAIFIVPSKYTDHQVDNMDAKMIWLGLQGDISHVPVSSMCFNHQGDLLFAGYGDGHYTVWDVQKASTLKVVTEHMAPVVHMLYLGQDTQVTRSFNVVSGDSKGVVKLIRFTVVPWLNRISYSKPIKLLDETTSRVVCASPLPCGDGHGGLMGSTYSSSTISTSSISSMIGGMVDEGVVIFITHQSALVAKVSPSVKVYAQILRPDCIREGALPYAAWRCLPQSHASMDTAAVQSSDKVSLLAIAWDQNIQVAKLLNSELKVLKKWTLTSAAIGVVWLGDETLAVLTLEAQLHLFQKDGSLIHQTSFFVDGFRGDDLISYHIYFTNASGNPEKAYHNSVAVRGTTIYVLGPEHLIVSRLLSWKERIEVLQKAGDWMGALNMAMALYDGQSHEVLDLPKNLNDIQRTVLPYFVELLQAYVTEVFSYMSVASLNHGIKLDQSDAIREQYVRAGGVAVEFCLHIKRPDILFEDTLSKFDEANHKETFLELLEPYILKDMLGSLPPAIMQALVEHYSKKGWLQRIEQCVLHMDILSLDFNQVIRICREHGLHCALIYLFNKGLDDFTTPLEELLIVYRNSSRENAASVGYRVLVYLKYCFLGLAFPPGRGNLPPTRLPSLRKELLQFLLEPSSTQNPGASTKLPSNGSCVNVLDLLELDTEATLEVLKCALTDDVSNESTHSPNGSTNFDMESAESQKLVQKIVDILADVVGANQSHAGTSFSDDPESWPSREDIGHVYAFIAYYVACERSTISRHVFHQILEYLTSESDSPDSSVSGNRTDSSKRREKQLLSLLQVVPEVYWDAPYVLQLSKKAQFHQVCGHIHAINHQFVAAMDNYMKVIHEPIYAFAFIHHMLRQLSKEEYNAFELAVLSRIPDLLKLSREGAYVLIIDHCSGKTQYILSELRSYPESLFLFLKTVIEVQTCGILNLSNLKKVEGFDFPGAEGTRQQSKAGVQAYLEALLSFPKNLQNSRITVNDEMSEVYFELLCQFDRGSVLNFLETSESYRVEHCLRLCQEYGIIDAASFLLEKVGDVGSALHLILSNLSEKFAKLDSEIHNVYPNATVDNLGSVLKSKVVAEIIEIVHACIGLCQRNSSRLQPEEAEQLWFELLDSFCEPLADSGNAKKHSERKAVKDTFNGSLNQLEYEGCKYKWKFFQYPNGARIMRKLFSIFIKEIVDGMVGYVRLPQIMWKLLSDNGGQEFGDFKLTILGMLGTYDFERKILDTARSLIEDDTYYTMNLLRKGASHGYAPRSPTCCICNTGLTKNSSDPGIQVFGCGHAIHLRCELQESDTSFRGCPICVPRRKAQRLNGKSSHTDGLLSRSTPQVLQTRGTSGFSPHDYESADSSYGFHQLSRFELLHNLERDKKLIQIENTNQLRLAPPALYHEKVQKGTKLLAAETSSDPASEKERSRSLRGGKVRGSSVLFPLKSSIFGKEKIWIK